MKTLALFLFLGSIAYAQVDFNDYRTIQAQGPIPNDFTAETYLKVEEGLQTRRDGMSTAEQREFLEATGYAIDDLLHSGLIVYGDPISNYVTAVADNLLKDQKELRSELRFYTLKADVTNAFSTDQGIIFVTTGLVAQLANEAQLAYILAHEISHYTEKHVVEGFNWQKSTKMTHNWISQLSIYKKDKEFEADRLAIDMYRKAGYSKEEIVPTFDVLLYSYLPFDEIKIELDYFATDKMFLPGYLFPSKEYEIKADPDEDDSESSHPNITKRKEAAQKELESASGDWSQGIFIQPEETFYQIRNIARFENVRISILNASIGNAIYEIYLLEREFPNSIFLKRMKAQAWLTVYQYEKLGRVAEIIKPTKEYEGSSAPVHYMIRKFNRASLTTFALRNIYDIHSNNKVDAEIDAVYHFMLHELGHDDKFSLDDYSNLTFQQAIDSNTVLKAQKASDTLTAIQDTVSNEEPKKRSKYDRISKKVDPTDFSASIDTTKYYIYGITDILEDSIFRIHLEEQRAEFQKENDWKSEYRSMSRAEQKQYDREHKYDYMHLGYQELIVVEPKVLSYNRYGIDLVQSEILEERFSESMKESADLAGLSLYSVDSRTIESSGSQGFNERNTLLSYFRQISNNSYKVNPFPVDFSLLRDLENNFGTANVMLTIVEHNKSADISIAPFLYSILFPPALLVIVPTYVPIKLMTANKTEITMVVMNINSGEVVFGDSYFLNEPIKKLNLGAHMYSLFRHLQINAN